MKKFNYFVQTLIVISILMVSCTWVVEVGDFIGDVGVAVGGVVDDIFEVGVGAVTMTDTEIVTLHTITVDSAINDCACITNDTEYIILLKNNPEEYTEFINDFEHESDSCLLKKDVDLKESYIWENKQYNKLMDSKNNQ